jgi:hypothetical protein
MLSRTFLAAFGTIAMAAAVTAPAASQAAPVAGAYAPSVETPVVDAHYSCVRKSGGQLACGYWTRWGFRQVGPSDYRYAYGYGPGYYGYYRPHRYW